MDERTVSGRQIVPYLAITTVVQELPILGRSRFAAMRISRLGAGRE